jgi:hypothetical protein
MDSWPAIRRATAQNSGKEPMANYKVGISMVPPLLWGANLRKRLTRGRWNKLRVVQFEQVPNCQYCGSSPVGSERHAHEDWVYNIKTRVALLVGLRTICRMCHFVEHPGFVNVMVGTGVFTPAIFDAIERHFCKVNGCKPQDFRRHSKLSQRRYEELISVSVWTIDFGPYADLVDSNTHSARGVKLPRSTPVRRRVRAVASVRLSDGAAT